MQEEEIKMKRLMVPVLALTAFLAMGCGGVVGVNTTKTEEDRSIASAPGAAYSHYPKNPVQRQFVSQPRISEGNEPTLVEVIELTNYAYNLYQNGNGLEAAFNAGTNAFAKLEFLMSKDGVNAGNVKYTRPAYNLIRTLGSISSSLGRTTIADRCDSDSKVLFEALNVQEKFSFNGMIPKSRIEAVANISRGELSRYGLTNKVEVVSQDSDLLGQVKEDERVYQEKKEQVALDISKLTARMNDKIGSGKSDFPAYALIKHKFYDSLNDPTWLERFNRKHPPHKMPQNAVFYIGDPVNGAMAKAPVAYVKDAQIAVANVTRKF
jgi:hypothetical protein